MKFKILIGVLGLAFIGAGIFYWQSSVAPPREKIQPLPEMTGHAPVYVTIYSHNEYSWKSMVRNVDDYQNYRDGLVDRANLLADYGVSWDWQSDLPVVEAMAEFEDFPGITDDTEGGNILVYLENLGVSLDPHAHTNNYADIAYVIESMGATPSSVIGGTIHVECGREHLGFLDFVSWHDEIELEEDGYVHGRDYPDALWQPLVLSDPGMGGHYFDDWTSGVWKPGNEADFYTHFPENDIVYIGEGYPHDTLLVGTHQASGAQAFASKGQYIKELVQKIKDGELPTLNDDGERLMYTASVHVRDTSTVTDGSENVDTLAGLEAMLNELMPLYESGDIIFVTFEETAEIWRTEYNEVPWYSTNLETFSFYDQVEKQARDKCETSFMGPSEI